MPQQHQPLKSSLTQVYAGWVLICMLLLAITSALTQLIPGYIAGIPVWFAVALMLNKQKRNQLIQSGVLFCIGTYGLGYGVWKGVDHSYLLKALEANQLLVAMIVSVSFLRIVATQNIHCDEQLPTGRKAMISTLFGTHLVGSVINMSSVMIMGDRLSSKKALTPLQGLTLLRAFSIAAIWSPFFAAMGVILISAPGAQLSTLVLFGLPTALIALLISAWQIHKHPKVEHTQGYPMHFKALWMPSLLALLVMFAHSIWPDLSVVTLVTIISILFVLLYVPFKFGQQSRRILHHHIHDGLPKLSSEITLFLAAAVMAAGVASLLDALQIRIAPEQFTALEANFTLVILVALAMIGMHPVTSAILAGSLLMPSVSDPNLLGITLLLSWMIGVGTSPFSGVQLSLQSRYGIHALDLLKLNRLYIPTMLLVGFSVQWIYSGLAGLS